MSQPVVGVDPGRSKSGYALVRSDGSVIEAGIVPTAELEDRVRRILQERPADCVAVGSGTHSRDVCAALAPLGLPLHVVDEYDTSRRARALYFADHPPRGWRRLVPLGMQLPPRPIDDYAAILIARTYLASVT